MDILDVWIPILIILLSVLNPLITSLTKKAKKRAETEKNKKNSEGEFYPGEMPLAEAGESFRSFTDRKKQPHAVTPVSVTSSITSETPKKRSNWNSIATDAPSDEALSGLLESLNNPKELKKAVILNEIFNRKYN